MTTEPEISVPAIMRNYHEVLRNDLAKVLAPLGAQWCVSAGIAHGGFEHFVAHGVDSLATHGSTKNPPAVAARVFVHSLKSVCTPEQWATYLPIARAAAPASVWNAIVTEVPSLEA